MQRRRGADALRSPTARRQKLANPYQVAERLRQSEPTRSAAIFALSGLSNEECRQQAAAAGFDGYLVKPMSVQTLEKLIPQCQAGAASRDLVFHGAHEWSLP